MENNRVAILRSILGALEVDPASALYQDTLSICQDLEHPIFRIAVFGPFNYGKSTLLNALLGTRALPIDIIPTTGAPIHVNYGQELMTQIVLTDGHKIEKPGTDILKTYAILDQDRQMRADVKEVKVFCPHPWLRTGVEFLDLPGTNDQEAQDSLVRDQLLTADLVVQVLDARQLMTLGERETLRDWLLDRGIETVIFVVNFVNLLSPEEQKEVYHRLRFIAESFRSQLPHNLSNLYRVDALPALRARLKGDSAAAQTTGLIAFESAMQAIVSDQGNQRQNQDARVQELCTRLQTVLTEKITQVTAEVNIARQKYQEKLAIKQKAATLIQKGFQASSSELQKWLYLPNLLKSYQESLVIALAAGSFEQWQYQQLTPALATQQQKIKDWVNKACEFFAQGDPGDFIIPLPAPPQVLLPPAPSHLKPSDTLAIPVTLATGVGFVFGGPVGAVVLGGASYLLGKRATENPPKSLTLYQEQLAQAYQQAAKDYLTCLSEQGLSELNLYEKIAAMIIHFEPTQDPLPPAPAIYQLELLQSLQEQLTTVAQNLIP